MRNGLGDRESSVKTAAGQLLATWVDIVRSNGTKKEEEEVKKEAVEELIEDLVAFLNLFDLTEGTVAEDALGSVFDTRKEFFEHLEIPGTPKLRLLRTSTYTTQSRTGMTSHLNAPSSPASSSTSARRGTTPRPRWRPTFP